MRLNKFNDFQPLNSEWRFVISSTSDKNIYENGKMESIPSGFSMRSEDVKRLRTMFYQIFDQSVAEHWLHSLSSKRQSASAHLLGEGYHFHCYRMRFQRGELCISIAKDTLAFNKSWMRAITLLQRIALGGIIPPFAVIHEGGSSPALVMPWGHQELAMAGSHWLPLDSRISETKQALKHHGLALMDGFQIRCWQGIPFIHDLSDLMALR